MIRGLWEETFWTYSQTLNGSEADVALVNIMLEYKLLVGHTG